MLSRAVGPATFHVGRTVCKIPYLRLEMQPSATLGKGFGRPVVMVLDRGQLPKNRTDIGELRLGDRQELTAWWRGVQVRT
jgi:hypothetical protein